MTSCLLDGALHLDIQQWGLSSTVWISLRNYPRQPKLSSPVYFSVIINSSDTTSSSSIELLLLSLWVSHLLLLWTFFRGCLRNILQGILQWIFMLEPCHCQWLCCHWQCALKCDTVQIHIQGCKAARAVPNPHEVPAHVWWRNIQMKERMVPIKSPQWSAYKGANQQRLSSVPHKIPIHNVIAIFVIGMKIPITGILLEYN